ncbi:hypothetical protein VOLCADRAFT_100245 [Volvox carteri f. nagariensis]|uniref:Pherophorin domain-containing protein n=1 Tax=Volvox carteri f. nagariensis TaxID=3068 RepID=D8UJT3_VOLCA|nr:uncharacterized protein VOLCADRAFT_100245 [Volvox carteri f. nagariensis]EFJ40009.1 hypothetical protein VOLCADRAFT_100245 [Volvox carteri f. nagariensis]|eukprot:XP_002958929.1 hypothetical protein VOLCADRAFT_100245 [Volvox carteri f. nagariensis]
MNAFAAFALLATVIRNTYALPRIWYTPSDIFPFGHKCTEHPKEAYGYAPHHKTPIDDPEISFIFRDPKGSVIKSFCPGAIYHIQCLLLLFFLKDLSPCMYSLRGPLSFSNPRLALLTASEGTFLNPYYTGPKCPNRVDLGGSDPSNVAYSYDITFQAPCSGFTAGNGTNAATSASGSETTRAPGPSESVRSSVTFKVTSAARIPRAQWRQSTATMRLQESCVAAAWSRTLPRRGLPRRRRRLPQLQSHPQKS